MILFRPGTLIFVGIALSILGLGYVLFFLGPLPFAAPDAPPDEIARVRFHTALSNPIIIAGIASVIAGTFWGLIRLFRRLI